MKWLSDTGSLKMSSGAGTSRAVEAGSFEQSLVIATSQIVEAGTLNELLKGGSTSNASSLGKDVQAAGISQEVKATTLKHWSREGGTSLPSKAGTPGKSALKKPLRAGIHRASEAGTAERVTLKQALRGMSISQASELASLKRLSRPPGTSQLSEAGTITQLFRTVVIPDASEPSTSKPISRTLGTSQLLEHNLKPSPRVTNAFQILEPCSSKPSSVLAISLSSTPSTSKATESLHQFAKARPTSSSEPGTSQQNEGTRKQKEEDAWDASLPASSLGPQISINSSDVVTGAFSIKNGNNLKISDDIGSEAKFIALKTSESSKSSERADSVDNAKSSVSRGSSCSGASEGSSCSSLSSSGNRPHMSNDSRWEAIRTVRMRDGSLGLSHFRLLKRLGCGDIGSVYLSELSGTRCYFAMKVMDKGSLASRKKLLRAQTEREILQSLDHPFLPTLYTHFETDKFSCLVMEYCPGGDLHTLRQRQPGKHFTEQAVRFYAAEVLVALEYLHVLGVVYRDLKPENVLIMEDGHIMLADFDLSRKLDVHPDLMELSGDPRRYFVEPQGRHDFFTDGADRKSTAFCKSACGSIPLLLPRKSKKEKKVSKKDAMSKMALIAEPKLNRCMSFVGTLEYLAPEIIAEKGHGSAVDWWTFGIFLYELLFGKTPFKGTGNHATLNNVVGQTLKFPESPTVSFAARDLVRGLLVKEPQNRLAFKRGATEIKHHPFFEGLNWALIRCSTPPEVPKPFETDLPLKTVSTGFEVF